MSTIPKKPAPTSSAPGSGIPVTLSNGTQITVIGPVVTILSDGAIHTSHRDFHAVINGETGIITIDDVEGATFPQSIVNDVNKTFDDNLPEILKAWQALRDHARKR